LTLTNVSLRLAVAIVTLYSAFAAFMFTTIVDESTIPGGAKVEVSGDTVATGGQGLPALIEQAARDAESVVAKKVPDLHDPAARYLYVEVGAAERSEADWLVDGYPWFSAGVSTVVRPGADLDGVDPRGTYFVFGPERGVEVVSAAFTDLGYHVVASPAVGTASDVTKFFLGGSFLSPTLVVLLLVALLVGTGVLSMTKAYAVQRLHGGTKRIAAGRDLRALAGTAVVSLTVVVGGSIVGLWFYNDLHQIGSFLRATFAGFLGGALVVLAIYVAVLRLVWDVRLIEGIKGRIGFRVAMPSIYLIRVPGLVLAVSLAASTMAAWGAVGEAAQAREDLAVAGDAAKIRFEGSVSPAEMDRLASESGAWLKREDTAGRVIFAHPVSTVGADDTHPDLLLVNDTYLEEQPVFDNDGERVTAAPPNTILLLEPVGSSLTSEDVVRYLEGSAADPEAPISFESRMIAEGQRHFVYATSSEMLPKTVRDVVVAVVNPDTGYVRDDDYMAYASQGSILVTDASEAAEHTPPELLGSWISAYLPVVQMAAVEHADRTRDFRVEFGSMIVALGVLLATAVGVAQIYVRGTAQQILVRYLHGWKFSGTHARLLVAEAVLAGLVLVVALVQFVSVMNRQGRAGVNEPVLRASEIAVAMWQPWMLLLVAALSIGLLLWRVRARTQEMIHTRSEEIV
jgi:hypothetical protein